MDESNGQGPVIGQRDVNGGHVRYAQVAVTRPTMHDSDTSTPSAWAPFSSGLFRELWLAAFVSNLGTWMQNVAAAWLMTTLSTSVTLVALV